ncbi:MAG: hypothetical protein AAB229_11015 [Candidatus Hydrogenedentota bacterium]
MTFAGGSTNSGSDTPLDDSPRDREIPWSELRHDRILQIILLAALVLRMWNISWGLPDATHRWPYHPDETNLFMGLAAFPPTFHPYDIAWGGSFFCLYGFHTLLGGLIGLFPLTKSASLFQHDPGALNCLYLWNRSLTVLLAWVSIMGLYLLARRLGSSRRGARIAALLFGITPFSVLHAHYLTVHTLTAFMAIAALLAFAGRTRPFATGFFGAATAGCEYSFGALWFGLAAVMLTRTRKDFLRFGSGSLLALPLFFSILLDPRGWWLALAEQKKFIQPGAHGPWFYMDVAGPATSYMLLAAGITGMAWAFRSQHRRAVLFVMILQTLALGVLGNPFARRFAFFYPCLAVCIGLMLEKIRRPPVRRILVAMLLVEPLLRSVALVQGLTSCDTRTLARAAVESVVPAGERIAVQNWFFAPHISTTRYRIVANPLGLIPVDSDIWCLTSERNGPSPEELREAGWSEVARIERPHEFLNFPFHDAEWPEDLRYTNPTIHLFRRHADTAPASTDNE